MSLWPHLNRRRPVAVEFVPSPDDVRVAEIDVQLSEIAVVPPPVRTAAMWHRLDMLLDLRFAIRPVQLRPSVPVVPGGAS